jgi:hypothetical protein
MRTLSEAMSRRFSEFDVDDLSDLRRALRSAADAAVLARFNDDDDDDARLIYLRDVRLDVERAASILGKYGFHVSPTAASESRGEGDGNGDAVSASQCRYCDDTGEFYGNMGVRCDCAAGGFAIEGEGL